MKRGSFNVICDSSWGSSAKGAASTRLADIYNWVGNVSSCNFPNAGHTAILGGLKFVGKVVPTPLILNTRERGLAGWVGAGSGFELHQLEKEIDETQSVVGENLFIHPRSVVVEQRHKDAEAPGGKTSTLHISSTMSGSGAAFADKAMRSTEVRMWRDIDSTLTSWDFWGKVQTAMRDTFLHEVSQGFALSIDHGTHYPQSTFRNCTPQQAYADFGIKPDQVGDVYLNVRSFPIRVGNNFDAQGNRIGYSGDVLPDQEELTWEQIGKDAEMPDEETRQLAERERTTVTKKIRRCFSPSWTLLAQSAKMCGATKLILNFPQYIHWSSYKLRGGTEMVPKLHPKVREYIDKMQEVTGLPVVMLGTGAEHDDYIFLG